MTTFFGNTYSLQHVKQDTLFDTFFDDKMLNAKFSKNCWKIVEKLSKNNVKNKTYFWYGVLDKSRTIFFFCSTLCCNVVMEKQSHCYVDFGMESWTHERTLSNSD